MKKFNILQLCGFMVEIVCLVKMAVSVITQKGFESYVLYLFAVGMLMIVIGNFIFRSKKQ